MPVMPVRKKSDAHFSTCTCADLLYCWLYNNDIIIIVAQTIKLLRGLFSIQHAEFRYLNHNYKVT